MFGSYKESHLFHENNPLTIEKHKASFRAFYKKQCKGISPASRKKKQNQILKQLGKLPFWSEADFIAGYKALREEPSLEPFYQLWEKKIAYPVVKTDRLEFYKSSGRWAKSSLSVLEPVVQRENHIPLDHISVFLVPGLAFDRRGGRLGRGKAYYDKTLAHLSKRAKPFYKTNKSHSEMRPKALLVGVAFVEQIHKEDLPLLEHDVLFDVLVTDQFVLTPLERHKMPVRQSFKKVNQFKRRGKNL